MTNLQPIVNMVNVEDVKGEAKKIYENFLSASKSVPKWIKVMANCEDILVGFFTMFKATMDDSPLPSVLKWKVAQEVSTINKCEFCIDVTNMQLKQFGLSDEEVANIKEHADEREMAALEYAREVTNCAYKIDENVVKNARDYFNDAELVELTASIGLFNYINRFNDALGVLPE